MDLTPLNLQGCGEGLEMKCESSASQTVMHVMCECKKRACHLQILMLRVWGGAPRGSAFLTISADADTLSPWTPPEKQGQISLYSACNSTKLLYKIDSKSLNGIR